MTSYAITSGPKGIDIEITGVATERDQLLGAFSECAAGQCACPTDEYEKVEAMTVSPAEDTIAIELVAKPGLQFDRSAIERCLDWTIEKALG